MCFNCRIFRLSQKKFVKRQKRIVDLNNPPKTLSVGEIVFKTKTGKYICSVCGYVYDPQKNNGVAFEDLPEDWKCPRCKQPKTKFNAA